MSAPFSVVKAICLSSNDVPAGCRASPRGALPIPQRSATQPILSHRALGHGTLKSVHTRSKILFAAVVAALSAGACLAAQTANPAPPTSSPVTAALPQDPSALLNPSGPTGPLNPNTLLGTGLNSASTGLVYSASARASYVPAGTAAGPGGFVVEQPTAGSLTLSLDDAISLGLERNIRLRYQRANQQLVLGYTGQATNALLPNLNFKAAASAQEIDLIALGFKPSLVGPLLSSLGLGSSSIPTIVKVNTTSVQLSLDQALFNLPDLEIYRAIKPEKRSVVQTLQDDSDQVVQAVTAAYLQVLADGASLQNTIAQEAAARVVFDQAVAREQAGVGIRLDTLRAQVTFQQRQQQHVSADAQLDKDGIQLNRIMGIPAGQQLDLTDVTPYSEIADLTVEQARDTAYAHRGDLLSLGSSLEVANHELRAVKYQRLPTLGVNGFYGILGEDTGIFHGVFTAEGTLRFPIFREAAQRGEEQTAVAQLQTLHDQQNNLRATIDAQIRTSLLDISSSDQLVKVAQSNVQLAQQELSDARDRFSAGVADNLEVVDALADVTSAQSQLVSALYQYNTAKVGLARNIGLVQTRYRAFLGM